MKSKIRRWLALGVILGMCLSLTGCIPAWLEKRIDMGNDELYNQAVDTFFAALDTGDAQSIREMFANSVIQDDPDLDEQIAKLIEVYPGPTDINRRDGIMAASASTRHGMTQSEAYSYFPVVSNGEFFWCAFQIKYGDYYDDGEYDVTQVLFYAAEDFCATRYDEERKESEELGLTVYADAQLDCEVRCVEGYPRKFTAETEPLNEGAAKAFLKDSNNFSEFTDCFGEPCSPGFSSQIPINDYVYELPTENGESRYLRILVHNGEIISADVVDTFEWLYKLWEGP